MIPVLSTSMYPLCDGGICVRTASHGRSAHVVRQALARHVDLPLAQWLPVHVLEDTLISVTWWQMKQNNMLWSGVFEHPILSNPFLTKLPYLFFWCLPYNMNNHYFSSQIEYLPWRKSLVLIAAVSGIKIHLINDDRIIAIMQRLEEWKNVMIILMKRETNAQWLCEGYERIVKTEISSVKNSFDNFSFFIKFLK